MCGIFAAFNATEASRLVYLGLHQIQHRAKEYAGIVTNDESELIRHTGRGIVQDVFHEAELKRLCGRIGLGHLRYSTVQDDETKDNAQPILGTCGEEPVAIAHNGNLTNPEALKKTLGGRVELQTTIDTELILRRLAIVSGNTRPERVRQALYGVQGTYALVFLFRDALIAVRDPSGNRPLSIGKRDTSILVSSETCALEATGGKFIRHVEPGEILVIDKSGFGSHKLGFDFPPLAECIFELIYFASPASRMFGEEIYQFRLKLGAKLEEICPTPGGELVIAVPDSSNVIALGYASSGRSGAFGFGILRNHYIGRTFIEPTQHLRETGVTRKFQIVPAAVYGKRIVIVDDSIVRGTTMPRVVRALRGAGAKEIHVRIACPRFEYSCHYGIDTPTRDELAAATMKTEEIRLKISADSLEFLPLDELKNLSPSGGRCYACLDGNYPIPISE